MEHAGFVDDEHDAERHEQFDDHFHIRCHRPHNIHVNRVAPSLGSKVLTNIIVLRELLVSIQGEFESSCEPKSYVP